MIVMIIHLVNKSTDSLKLRMMPTNYWDKDIEQVLTNLTLRTIIMNLPSMKERVDHHWFHLDLISIVWLIVQLLTQLKFPKDKVMYLKT